MKNFRFISNQPLNQRGVVLPVVLLLIALVGIVGFFLISSTFPFKDQLMSNLFPKSASRAAGVIDLSLAPDTLTVKPNETFLVSLQIDTKTEKASCIDFEINYDPQILEATALEPGFFFTEIFSPTTIASGKAHKILCQRFDPVTGTDAFKTGTGTVATLAFKALKATTSPSQIAINSTTTQISTIGKTENDLGSVTNSFVTVSESPTVSKNATFTFAGPTVSQPTNQEIPVRVQVQTTDAANLFVAKLSFDPAKFSVARIDTAGTFITQWASTPSYSNTNGTVSIIGGVPNPGYTNTSSTTMATVYFRALAATTGTISYDASSVIYRNSDNANILNNTNSTITLTVTGPTVTPTPSATPTPTPSVTPSQTPTASASPTASSSPVASPSTAASASPVASVPTTNCIISSAAWNTTVNPINQGKVVGLKATGNASCAGLSVSFNVWEDDGVLGTDAVDRQPPIVKFDANGTANTSWLAEFQTDGFNGINNPPEYYFLASVTGGASVKSADPLLVVTPATTGQGLKGDANRDSKVDFTDLSILLTNWNKTSGFNDELDYNDDGVINTFDFAGLIQLLILNGLVS